jgi:pimeloyl-ACP methyl ester carboxylesterase
MALPIPELPGVEHRFVEVGGLRIHVAEAGEGDPLVLLHGWPQNWWEWKRLIPLLAVRYRVLCLDTRGSGWSDAPTSGYDKETMARDVLTVLDELQLDRVRMVGHDVGGYLGFLICLDAPERVVRYVALNTGHPFVRPTPAALGTFWRFWYWPVNGAPLLGPWLIRHDFFRVLRRWFTADRAGWSSEDDKVFLEPWRERARAVAASKTYRTYLLQDSPRVLNGRYRRTRLNVPTLMLHGIEDRILREPFLRGFEPFADDMTLELVPGAGHFIADEQPELVSRRVLEFFEPASP